MLEETEPTEPTISSETTNKRVDDTLLSVSPLPLRALEEFVKESKEIDYAWFHGRLDEYLANKLKQELFKYGGTNST